MKCKLLLGLALTLAAIPADAQTRVKREDTSPHTSAFVAVNGIKLHYLDWGGKGQALLFIAGSDSDAHTFDEMAPRFTDRFRVLALTRRGHGESDKPETGYDLPTLADDVRQFLAAMRIERVNLVGHSAGGNELIQFARDYPKQTLKLVFLEAAYDRREVLSFEEKDPLWESDVPLAAPTLADRIEATYFKHMDEFEPDFKSIKAPALSFYAIFETHWGLKPDTDEAMRRKAQDFIEKYVQPYQWRNIERFRKEVVSGRVVVIRGSNHSFFKDPRHKDEVVGQMRTFLSRK